jgi:hypothetical protein
MLHKEKIAVCCENRNKHTNTFYGTMNSFSKLNHVVIVVTTEP